MKINSLMSKRYNNDTFYCTFELESIIAGAGIGVSTENLKRSLPSVEKIKRVMSKGEGVLK